ncbi:MAG: energy transducer TonB [Bacteroidota bacterium]
MIINKNRLLFIFLIFFINGFSQPVQDKQSFIVGTTAQPSFPKGDHALFMYVLHNVNYSEESKKKSIEGEVTLSFDVAADSSVSNIVVISSVGYGIETEVKRLVQKLKFIPAVENGYPVKMNTLFSFPIVAR